ncbi:hypothetical protein [Natrarchaeobius chitinivorans]|uniref:Uncharacterized protein n=1 Tax=Natrarchaeobius chitinivorans TaxID=1679083 RepID=A0A3N6MKS6_NATCH|nr:hypothetical protein [Natrarchaeobius chitinivorans]RQG94896.1 hypothetical protein EA473_10380 [Natrarchaeobius chitinivorans]
MPADRITFTADTEITITDRSGSDEPGVDALHLEDLSPILEVEHEDGTVTSCELDVEQFVDVMSLYASMETLQYDWRSPGV